MPVSKNKHQSKQNGWGFIIGSLPFFGIGLLGLWVKNYFETIMQTSDEIGELIGNTFMFSSFGSLGLGIALFSFFIGITFILFGILRNVKSKQ